jgi:hypothetical protein
MKKTIEWIINDYNSSRVRFVFECLAWAISIGCALVMAFTVPNPPLIYMYPCWISGCAIYAACAWSRESFGMFMNYMLLVTIDIIGLVRMLLEAK